MATGDLANNLRKLQKELKLIKFSENVDLTGMSQGTPTAFLPIYHYLFTSYSHAIAEMISSSDTELYGKTDFRFIEAVYKVMRDMFSYKPMVTKEQFFNAGFAERKIIMCAEVIQMIREKNKILQPNKKSTTSAVSTISQSLNKKPARPKTAESIKQVGQLSTGRQPPRPTLADQQKQVKFAPEEVVNELRQPPKHQSSRHIAHKEPPSPVAIVHMSPSVTKEIVSMEENPSRGFRYAVVTPAVAKMPIKSHKSGETNAIKGLNFEDCGVIEEVNAVTPDTSLYEPLHNSTAIVHGEMQVQIETLQQSVEQITEKLSGFESAMSSVTKVLHDQSGTDPNLIDIVTHIQQQIENITARMVLIENRVSIVESKLQHSTVLPSTHSEISTNGHIESNRHILPRKKQECTSSQIHQSEVQMSSRPGDIHSYSATTVKGYSSAHDNHSKASPIQFTDIHQNNSVAISGNSEEPIQRQNPNNSPNINYSGNSSSIPSHLANSDQFSFALSPIRTIKDTSAYKQGPNATGEDTFALEAEDDARRSSTPTDFKDLPIKKTCDESLSFHCLDISTKQKADRIKDMMVSTKSMLNK